MKSIYLLLIASYKVLYQSKIIIFIILLKRLAKMTEDCSFNFVYSELINLLNEAKNSGSPQFF